jgi:hypothetical protein
VADVPADVVHPDDGRLIVEGTVITRYPLVGKGLTVTKLKVY